MEDLNYCDKGGHLVGPQVPLADSPQEFHLGVEPTVVGCTRLWCSLCRNWVRITPDSVSEEVEYRIYSCKCPDGWSDITEVHLWGEKIESLDEHEYIVIPYHWRCAGHPIQSLPFELDGVRIDKGIDFDELVSKCLDGWSPDLARPKEREYVNGWLLKLYARLTKTGLEHSIPESVSMCLTHPSARVRSAALRFFLEMPNLTDVERIVKLATGDRSLFRGIPDPLTKGLTLDDSLLRLLGVFIGSENERASQVREVARSILLQPGRSQALYWGVYGRDKDWFLENLEKIVRANPRGLEELFLVVSGSREFPIIAAKIARLECVNPEKVRCLTKKYLKGSDRLIVTRALEQRRSGLAPRSVRKRDSTRKDEQDEPAADRGYAMESDDPDRRGPSA